jgi:hypothetical protein
MRDPDFSGEARLPRIRFPLSYFRAYDASINDCYATSAAAKKK